MFHCLTPLQRLCTPRAILHTPASTHTTQSTAAPCPPRPACPHLRIPAGQIRKCVGGTPFLLLTNLPPPLPLPTRCCLLPPSSILAPPPPSLSSANIVHCACVRCGINAHPPRAPYTLCRNRAYLHLISRCVCRSARCAAWEPEGRACMQALACAGGTDVGFFCRGRGSPFRKGKQERA
eukprot:3502731-Rhodomonas_salina.1